MALFSHPNYLDFPRVCAVELSKVFCLTNQSQLWKLVLFSVAYLFEFQMFFVYFFRLSMSPEEHSEFWRKVQFTVDKDVVRTDRSNHFFRGENNPNVEIMRSEYFCSFPALFFNSPPPISISISFALSVCHLLSHPSLSFPFLSPTLGRTYSFHILNPGGAANEFHALLTLTKPSEHF